MLGSSRVFVRPGDLVQVEDHGEIGEVLDWNSQNSIAQRDLAESHVPIRLIAQLAEATPRFWPRAVLTLVKAKAIAPRFSHDLEEFRL